MVAPHDKPLPQVMFTHISAPFDGFLFIDFSAVGKTSGARSLAA